MDTPAITLAALTMTFLLPDLPGAVICRNGRRAEACVATRACTVGNTQLTSPKSSSPHRRYLVRRERESAQRMSIARGTTGAA